jgi:hypothetical protein
MKEVTSKDVTESYEVRRNNAIGLVRAWANDLVQVYEEPTRAGTKKGQPIGLSKKKLHAAILMILYGPLGLSLKEISTISKVSPGLIRLWRTEPDFKRAIKISYDSFSEVLLNTIDMVVQQEYEKNGDNERQKIFDKDLFEKPHLPSYLINGEIVDFRQCSDPLRMVIFLSQVIPFLNNTILPAVEEWLKKRIDSGSFLHSHIMRAMGSVTAKNIKLLRKWHIDHLTFTKIFFEFNLARLTITSEDISKMPYEERDRMFSNLRQYLFQVLDVLAS